MVSIWHTYIQRYIDLSTQALCFLVRVCLAPSQVCAPSYVCALLSQCLQMPGPHLLKYVVPLYQIDDKTTFLIYVREWYRFQWYMFEAMWSMWTITAEGDQWWHPETWLWVGSKHLRGPNEESVTDFWPHLTTWHPKTWLPDAMEVYTFNSWKDVGGSDTWVKCLSDEGPLWWTYHCSEPKEGIFWKKAKWSGARRMDWEKMYKTKAKPERVLRLRGQVTDSANAKAKAKAKSSDDLSTCAS